MLKNALVMKGYLTFASQYLFIKYWIGHQSVHHNFC